MFLYAISHLKICDIAQNGNFLNKIKGVLYRIYGDAI